MPLPRTLARYVGREVALHTAIGGLALTAVLLGANLLRHGAEASAAGLGPADGLALAGGLLLVIAPYVLPLAILFGALAGTARLVQDREVLAFAASGLGPTALLAPVLLLGLGVSALDAAWMHAVEHRAKRWLHTRLHEAGARGALPGAGAFGELEGRVVRIGARDGDGGVEDVLVSDHSDPDRPLLIVAERGRLRADTRNGHLRLELTNGEIHVEPEAPESPRYRRLRFARFETELPVPGLGPRRFEDLRPGEMTLGELRAIAARADAGESLSELPLRRDDPNEYRVAIHRRFALPAAPAIFALVAVPLALARGRGGRAGSALVCAAAAFAYYVALAGAQQQALAGRVPAAAALWAPNALFLAGAAALWWRTLRRAP